MTVNIIICHGAYGRPNENWYFWLGSELAKSGCNVFIPRFPTPENQSLENWLKVLEKYENYFGSNTILIGHSISCALVLKKIESLKHPIKAAFLVAGFIGGIGIEKFDAINSSFFAQGFDWKNIRKIRKNCSHFEVFHSDNDTYLPIEKGEELAKKLGVKLTLVRGAGHFNEKSGYRKFPLLLERIRRLF